MCATYLALFFLVDEVKESMSKANITNHISVKQQQWHYSIAEHNGLVNSKKWLHSTYVTKT